MKDAVLIFNGLICLSLDCEHLALAFAIKKKRKQQKYDIEISGTHSTGGHTTCSGVTHL